MFSIVMPLWNKRPMVAATVAGVLAQTWAGFELIVVDDGSTDGGMAMLDRFEDPRIRRIRQANSGPGAARNRGMAAANHDWIAFLDADDLWLPDHLAELDRIRTRHPDAGLIASSFNVRLRDASRRIAQPRHPRIERVDYLERIGRGEILFHTSSAAVSRRAYQAIGGFCDAPIGQDIEYWTRIGLDWPMAVSNRVTSIYVSGTGGICDTLRSPCRGRELREAGDIAPGVRLVIERYPGIRCADRRRAADRFIDQHFKWCTRTAAVGGDRRTLCALPRLHLRPPRLQERLIIGLAHLPAPVAQAAFGFGFRLKAVLRSLARPRAAPVRRRLGSVRTRGDVQPKPLHHVAEQASS